MALTDILKELDKTLTALVKQGRQADAQQLFFDRIAPLSSDFPDSPDILYFVGTACMQLKMFGLAISMLRRCMDSAPRHWQNLNNLGCCYKSIGKRDIAADILFEASRQGGSQNPDLMNNIGGLYTSEGEPEKAIYYAKRAIELCETDAARFSYMWNLALSLMEMEQWEEGFELYEAGILSGDRGVKRFTDRHGKQLPLWNRQPGQRLILCAEQGLGDNILFASCFEHAHRDTRFVLDCHPRLYSLYRRSFQEIEMYPTYKEAQPHKWLEYRDFDAAGGVGSLLGLYYKQRLENPVPYLIPNLSRVAYWRERLERLGEGPYIGFAWKGGTPYSGIWQRIIKIGAFKPLFALGGQWLSLQYTPEAATEVANLKVGNVHHWADAVQVFDYDETAAFVSALDYVVTPPTAIVHLTGGLGKTGLVMVPFERAWRYPEGDRMYWYRDVMQIHKPKGMSWEDFILAKMVHRMNSYFILRQT